MKNTKEYKEAKQEAFDEHCDAGGCTDLFELGYDYAKSEPKHIFDGIANVGEKRRFEGKTVDVVVSKYCEGCVLSNSVYQNCMFFTGCGANNVMYIPE